MKFIASWPIEDQNQTMRELTREATDDLHRMLERRRLMVDGRIQWKVNTGEQPRLTAKCAVRQVFTIRDMYGNGRAA